MLLVKNLTDCVDALLSKAGNWSGKDRLSAVLKKIKKDVSKDLDSRGELPLNVTCHTPPCSIKKKKKNCLATCICGSVRCQSVFDKVLLLR